ncbi:MAG TPA: hypothetical protein VIN59_04385 [Alphaproteobacteria bacterium]
MPYNSSSFERQLAKYKQAQAEKAVAQMPRKYEDPHHVKSQISSDRGTIRSYALEPTQMVGDGAQSTPVAKREPIVLAPIIIQGKKPLFKRTWFLVLVLTTLPTLAAPVLFKDQWNELMGVADTVRSSTGVDPFAMSTYTNLFKGRAIKAEPAEQASAPDNTIQPLQPKAQTESALDVTKDMSQPMDMNNAVEHAQERTEAITSKGADYSMKYIEEETKRLNDAAKQFDQQYKK